MTGFKFLARPAGLPWHKCLRANRNDLAVFHLPNLLVFAPVVADATLVGSRPVGQK